MIEDQISIHVAQAHRKIGVVRGGIANVRSSGDARLRHRALHRDVQVRFTLPFEIRNQPLGKLEVNATCEIEMERPIAVEARRAA